MSVNEKEVLTCPHLVYVRGKERGGVERGGEEIRGEKERRAENRREWAGYARLSKARRESERI